MQEHIIVAGVRPLVALFIDAYKSKRKRVNEEEERAEEEKDHHENNVQSEADTLPQAPEVCFLLLLGDELLYYGQLSVYLGEIMRQVVLRSTYYFHLLFVYYLEVLIRLETSPLRLVD